MNRGPKDVTLGVASCDCGADIVVATNKHGFPGAYCKACRTQVQPRAERGAQILLGRVHTWENLDAASAMLAAGDVPLMARGKIKAGKLPPHLSTASGPAQNIPAAVASASATPKLAAKPKAPKAATPAAATPVATPAAPKTSWWDRQL